MLRTLSYLGAELQKQAVLSQTQVRLFRSNKKRVRKPLWMPRAPTKLFNLPKHPKIPRAEKEQYWELAKNYHIEVKSIQMYWRAEQDRVEAEKGKFSEVTIHEEEGFEAQLRAVEAENKEIAERRKVLHEKAFQKRIAALMEKAKQMDEAEQQQIDEARKIFNKEMENFTEVTLDTLDDVIAKALNNPTDYNFAVTATGEILREEPKTRAE